MAFKITHWKLFLRAIILHNTDATTLTVTPCVTTWLTYVSY